MYTMYDWMKDAENASRMEGRDEGIALGTDKGRAQVFAKLRSRHVDEALIQDIEADFSREK